MIDMPNLRLRIYPDECLRKKSAPVKGIGPGERMLIKAMLQTMYDSNGIGQGPLVAINPKVLRSRGTDAMEEGCLSLPGVGVEVKRAERIEVSYTDLDNQVVKRELSGLLARVFLHESDHLLGKLICDYAGLYKKFKLRTTLKSLKQQHQPIL